MSTNPLTDIAPYPLTEASATAEAIAKHLTAQAYLTSGVAFEAAREAFTPGAESDPEKVRAYGEVAARSMDQFGAVYLLRALVQHAPDKVEEVARGLWECWRDGGAMPEFLYDWLTEYGIDPGRVDAAATNLMRDAA